MPSFSNEQIITELYLGYYNRAPDTTGLDFWLGSLDHGTTVPQIADLFITSAEPTTSKLPIQNSDIAADIVYVDFNNILNRIVDAAGLDFWTNQLLTGKVTAGGLVLAIEQSVNAQNGTADSLTLQAKLTGAEYFVMQTKASIALGIISSQMANAAAVMAPLAAHSPATAIDVNNSEALTDQLYGGGSSPSLPITHHVIGVIDPPHVIVLA